MSVVERIGQSQHSRQRHQFGAALRRQSGEDRMVRRRQSSAMIVRHDGNALQILFGPTDGRCQISDHAITTLAMPAALCRAQRRASPLRLPECDVTALIPATRPHAPAIENLQRQARDQFDVLVVGIVECPPRCASSPMQLRRARRRRATRHATSCHSDFRPTIFLRYRRSAFAALSRWSVATGARSSAPTSGCDFTIAHSTSKSCTSPSASCKSRRSRDHCLCRSGRKFSTV